MDVETLPPNVTIDRINSMDWKDGLAKYAWNVTATNPNTRKTYTAVVNDPEQFDAAVTLACSAVGIAPF